MEKRFETFTTVINKISRNIRKIKSEEVKDIAPVLKGPHVTCLYYLYKHDNLTSKELCSICDEDKAAVSRSIDYLENNGYIENNSQEKRYKSSLSLTEKGKQIAKKVCNRVDQIVNLASKGLSEKDRLTFYKALILISDNLQNYSDKYGE